MDMLFSLIGGNGTTEDTVEETRRRRRQELPPVTDAGMMRWKEWWWNHPAGLRQCDGPDAGGKAMEDAEKVAVIKRTWQIDGDAALLGYLQKVRAHARTHEWEGEDGLIYTLCDLYQADLQSVLDHLLDERKQHVLPAKSAAKGKGKTTTTGRIRPSSMPLAAQQREGTRGGAGKPRKSATTTPSATAAAAPKARPEGAGTAAAAPKKEPVTAASEVLQPMKQEEGRKTTTPPAARRRPSSAAAAAGAAVTPVVAARRRPKFTPETWHQPSCEEFPEIWLRGGDADAAPNEELIAMFAEDQKDRMPPKGQQIDWEDVGPRDEARRARVLEILAEEQGRGCVAPLDFYHAAFMCHHASAEEVDFYRAANLLALEAVRLCPKNARYRWLFAAAKDRLLRALGKPQLFGIQKCAGPTRGVWWIPGGVEPWVTEQMRRDWAAPTLEEVERRRGRRLTNKE